MVYARKTEGPWLEFITVNHQSGLQRNTFSELSYILLIHWNVLQIMSFILSYMMVSLVKRFWSYEGRKVEHSAKIQPKSQFLFHKYLPPRDFPITTLTTSNKFQIPKPEYSLFFKILTQSIVLKRKKSKVVPMAFYYNLETGLKFCKSCV